MDKEASGPALIGRGSGHVTEHIVKEQRDERGRGRGDLVRHDVD